MWGSTVDGALLVSSLAFVGWLVGKRLDRRAQRRWDDAHPRTPWSR